MSVDGIQITINMDDGRTVSVVQENGNYKFNIGDLVEVVSINGKTRVLLQFLDKFFKKLNLL
ncbi:MAG: hypothetical protein CM15mP86_13490 [Gammaproteobacteria bacterium]|nr:MAG: hypothetical protein CM15mP86_13490 [Gammaproteobacteria bacterium]